MKITFITGHLCKERHALLNELALDLGEYGAEVTVITGFPSRRISEEVKDYYLAHPVEQISPNVVVKRVGSRKGEGGGLFDRMIKYAKLTWTIYKEAKKTPTDAYYLYSSPFFIGWMGCKLAKIAPTVYNAQDLFPDTLIKIKGYGEGNPMIKFFRKMERKVYKKNTRIITISEEMKRTIMAQECPADKIDVIYNWADTETLHHVERADNKLMDELNVPKDQFIVSYAGDIGLFQGWPVIVEAAKRVHAVKPDVLFVIIGSGSYKAQLEKQVADEKLDFIEIRPMQPASRCAEIYSIGDLELVSIEPGLSKMALPSKTFVIMSSGSAVLSLVDQTSDIAQLIKSLDMGYTLEHGDPEALKNVILEAYEKRDHLTEQGKNARKFAEENAARKTQTKKYYDVIKSLVK
jgi:glycosyltransferase involved in cell wall biosynthesis